MMANERINIAIGRLDRAVARVEGLAGQSISRPQQPTPHDPDLHKRHDLLRDQVEAAFVRIDALIRSAEV